MIEHLLETISERIEDITDGRLKARWVKAFLRMVGVLSPPLLAGYFLYFYGEDQHHYKAWHWPRISLVIGLLVATVILLFVSWKKWSFKPLERSKLRAGIVLTLDVILIGFTFFAEHQKQEEYKALKRETGQQKFEEKFISNPNVIFEKVASVMPAFREDARKSFIGAPVGFKVKFVNATKDAPGFHIEADGSLRKRMEEDYYTLELVYEENGATVATVYCSFSVNKNPGLIDLKPGQPFLVQGDIAIIDPAKKTIRLENSILRPVKTE